MGSAFVKILVGTLAPVAATAVANELKAGSKLDVAARNTIAKLETLIPVPALRQPAEDFLNHLITAAEELGLAATSVAGATQAAQ